nr:amidohydrolase family protein [Acidimicrobiia bacterium]
MTATVVERIGLLVTNTEHGELLDAHLVMEGGLVVAVGTGPAPPGDRRIDAAGRCVLPGFVDSHTHLVFAGDRAEELAARMTGAPYEAGGIRVTTEATREAGFEPLLELGRTRRAEGLAAGITHVEVKSGYGLEVESERRLCEVAGELTDDVTFLGAHAVPAEYEGRADEYVELVSGEMLS